MTGIFRDALHSRILICDGAMGTLLYAGGIAIDRPPVETNLWRPETVRAIHSAYISAGTDIITTNTFGASRLRLAPFGVERHVVEINRAAARIAREARDRSGASVFVAGSISPATPPGHHERVGIEELRATLSEQIESLADGVDLLIFETFGDLGELCEAVSLAKPTNLPMIAQLTFADDRRTLAGDRPDDAARALEELGVAALGVNCTLGPRGVLEAIRGLAAHTTLPLIAQANAGLPSLVDGAFHYPATSEYFAGFVPELVALGTTIVGGCCGTTPDHIRSMAVAAHAIEAPKRRAVARERAIEIRSEPSAGTGTIGEKITERRYFIACAVGPGDDPERTLTDAAVLRDYHIDALALGPARGHEPRLSPITFAVLARQRLGLDTIISTSTWGRTGAALTAELLGAHALALRTVICETGAQPPRGDYPHIGAIGEMDSIGLIRMLTSLNEGAESNTVPIGRPTSFIVGAYVNPGPEWLPRELERARRKVEAGAKFFVTRPVFDSAAVQALLAAMPAEIPVVLTVMPLQGRAHAEYLRYEVPELYVPDAAMDRLRAAGSRSSDVGIELARDLVLEFRESVAGVILSSATGTVQEMTTLLQALPG